MPVWALAGLVSTGCIFITKQDVADRQPPHVGVGKASLSVVLAGYEPDPAAPVRGPTDSCLGIPEPERMALPLSDVPVVLGAATVRTDRSGRSVFAGLDPVETTLTAETAGWTPIWLGLTLPDGAGTAAALGAVPVESRAILRPDLGGAFGVDCVYSLAFGAGALGGSTAVKVDYAWVPDGVPAGPPKVAPDGRPLDLVALVWVGDSSGGDETPGGALLRVSVASGDPIRSEPERAVYWFDEAAGQWVDQGAPEEEPAYLVAPLDAWGWWAIGAPTADLGCGSGAAVAADGSAPVADAEVEIISDRRPGWWRSVSGADGGFCAPLDSGHSRVAVRGADEAGDVEIYGEVPASSLPLPQLGRSCGDPADVCADLGQVFTAVYADADHDQFLAQAVDGSGGDCDDSDPNVGPDRSDPFGDGVDQNCDGTDGTDEDGDGSAVEDGDCDDQDPAVHPGAAEHCDGADNDCDGLKDADDPDLDDAVPLGVGTSCVACTSEPVMDLEPKLYWRLDDGPGAVHDSSGFGNDGDSAGLTTRYPGITQQPEDAPWFSGDLTDYARLLHFDDMGTRAFTLSMWVRPELDRRTVLSYAVPAPSTTGVPACPPKSGITPEAAAANELGIVLLDSSVKVVLEGQQNSFEDALPDVLPLGEWSHLAVTWGLDAAGDEIAIYVDGEFKGSFVLTCDSAEEDTSDTGAPGPYEEEMVPGGILYLGQNQDAYNDSPTEAQFSSWQAYGGLVDEVALFDRVLDATEIQALYLGANCGEKLCDGVDNDGDGLVDEHIVGSESCPAADCDEVVANDSSAGDGDYWLDDGLAFCENMDTSTPDEQFCGDGQVFNDADHTVETCDGLAVAAGVDPADCASCNASCACVVPAATSCQDLYDAGFRASGPYEITDAVLGDAIPVRCLMDDALGAGWTLVHSHDSAAGFEAVFDPGVGKPPAIVPVLDGNEGDPFASAYSILGRLGDFGGPQGYSFRMDWPLNTPSSVYEWNQSSNPADPTGAVATGFLAVSAIPDASFAGLEYRDDGYVFIAGTDASLAAVCDLGPCSLWYTVGVFRNGLQGGLEHADYLLGASPIAVPGGDGTARKVELWVRPW